MPCFGGFLQRTSLAQTCRHCKHVIFPYTYYSLLSSAIICVFFANHNEVSVFTDGNCVIMQAWSITYHSCLTFVLLLLANVLWILPNQRHYMMRCSPILVVYAMFLLLAQYICGMDLTIDELPEKVNGVNLHQIGFTRTTELPCEPLFIKVMCFI
jgi:hypothetical protein